MSMTLVIGDIMRDGGSLAVDFQRDDGSLLSIMLEVDRSVEAGEPRRYRHLHVGSTIQNRCDSATIIEKGSAEETLLLSTLDNWLEKTAGIAPLGKRRDFETLRELRTLIPLRDG